MAAEALASFKRRCADTPGNPDHYAIPIKEVSQLLSHIAAIESELAALNKALNEIAAAENTAHLADIIVNARAAIIRSRFPSPPQGQDKPGGRG